MFSKLNVILYNVIFVLLSPIILKITICCTTILKLQGLKIIAYQNVFFYPNADNIKTTTQVVNIIRKIRQIPISKNSTFTMFTKKNIFLHNLTVNLNICHEYEYPKTQCRIFHSQQRII